ncbi:MAG: crossover junction endodeoxyribonuclease RuvC [Planctomycetota bacterium]|nr:crossover junction endodeoxyribonuclease RuvC [Planctomycetota bacterium]
MTGASARGTNGGPDSLRIVGIDPGTQIIGFALLEKKGSQVQFVEAGVIRAPRGAHIAARLRKIYEGLLEVIRRTEPDVVVVEQAFFGKSVRDALRIGEGRGIALLAAGTFNLPVAEYAPAQVKKAATGNGRARKSQVQDMVRRMLDLKEIPPPDAADAIAIALCHCHRSALNERIGVEAKS